jgi:hypothetical protein
VDALRVELRKDLIGIIKRGNKKYAEIGRPYVDPGDFFYPVQKKSLKNRIIDGFDIAYSTAMQPDSLDSFISNRNEIELSDEQGIDLVTMFNSHGYQVIHSSNVADVVNMSKRVFSDPRIRKKLEENIGGDGIKRIFGYINSLEHGGAVNAEMSRGHRQFLQGILRGTAIGALGLNFKTYAVNALSMTNFLQDASIPLRVKAQATLNTIKVIATLPFKGGNKNLSALRNSRLIKRRFRAGANTLLQIIKGDMVIEKPNTLRTLGNLSMQAIGTIDTGALFIGSMAAYEAHSIIGKEMNITDAEELHKFATEGMVRTITKTSQPNMLTTKSLIEQSSNPYFGWVHSFMSEQRKSWGLEFTALKKFGVKPGELLQLLLINHIILGSAVSLIRGGVGALLGEDDPIEPEDLFTAMLMGPSSGFLIVGDLAQAIFKRLYNEIAEYNDLDKVKTYPAGATAAIRTLYQITDFTKIWDPEATTAEQWSAIGRSFEGVGAATNNSTISYGGSLIDFVGDMIKMVESWDE